jgi:esterase/lipase
MSLMKKVLISVGGVLGLATLVYLSGPQSNYPPIDPLVPELEIALTQLDDSIATLESNVPNIKPGNHAMVIWADSIKKTEWSIVYLHGFSASHHEGHPVHVEVAKHFGMNLYLSRIDAHGIDDEDIFQTMTPASMINTAKFAIGVGQLIGEKVIVMSCSTGGTYSIFLAAHNPEKISAQILYSPNIEVYDPRAKLLGKPWGLQLGKALLGDYRTIEQYVGTPNAQFTTIKYRTEGLVALQHLLDETMKASIFQKITQPTFLGYYFKNDEEQDNVVSVKAMREFAANLNTRPSQLREIAFPEAENHVICSEMLSKDYKSVRDETIQFIEEVLKIAPINTPDNN